MERSSELEQLLVLWRDILPNVDNPRDFKSTINDCPLCRKYRTPDTCSGCPVFAKTGRSHCRGVWQLYNVYKAHRAWAAKRIDKKEYESSFPDLVKFIESLE